MHRSENAPEPFDIEAALELAHRLAVEAGDLAVAERHRARIETKGGDGDVVTHVDREAERRILTGLRARYPEHDVLGEESGLRTADPAGARSRYRWLIDPLDGTHDYVLDIDVFGVCITLLRDDDPVLAVIHDSPRRRTLWATAGGGAFWDGRRVRVPDGGPLRRATVSWLQGYAVGPQDAERDRAFGALETSCKRTLRTWCPSLDWRLLATGRTQGLVAYRNEAWDLAGGLLIAREAGAAILGAPDGPWAIAAPPDLLPALAACIGLDPGSGAGAA